MVTNTRNIWERIKQFIAQTFNNQAPTIIFEISVISKVTACITPYKNKRHEGIVYFLGNTDGVSTNVVDIYAPKAFTSSGSFKVPALEMAILVQYAVDRNLQVVGQLHTHPSLAYHSGGDMAGMANRFPGYCSIVIPDYGNYLPSLQGANIIFFLQSGSWVEIEHIEITGHGKG